MPDPSEADWTVVFADSEQEADAKVWLVALAEDAHRMVEWTADEAQADRKVWMADSEGEADFTVHVAAGWAEFVASFGDLVLRVAGDDITGLSDGALVSSWEDTSPEGNDLVQATASKQPEYVSESRLTLKEAAGSSTAQGAATPAVGLAGATWDVRAELALDDWSPAGNQLIATEGFGVADGGFFWIVEPGAGATWYLTFQVFPDGDTYYSPALFLSGRLQVRCTSDGADVTFLTAAVGSDDWTDVGTAFGTGPLVNPMGQASVVAGNKLTVGGVDDANAKGRVYSIEARSSIGGTVVASPDFTAQPAGTTSFDDDQGNTWTVNGSAAIRGPKNDRPVVYFDGINDDLRATLAAPIPQPLTAFVVAAGNGGDIALLLSIPLTDGLLLELLDTANGGPSVSASMGSTEQWDTTEPITGWNLVTLIADGAASTVARNGVVLGTKDLPAVHAMATVRVSSFDGVATFAEVLVYARAFTTVERQRVERALGARWGVTIP